jgi:hypothetical protein
MEIKLVKKAGVPRAEIDAHQQIQREFSNSALSRNWRGYAYLAEFRRQPDVDLNAALSSVVPEITAAARSRTP